MLVPSSDQLPYCLAKSAAHIAEGDRRQHRGSTMLSSSVSRIALTLMLGGCSLIPPYQQPPAPIPANYPSVSGSNQAGSQTELTWSEFIHDERLKRLVSLALVNNRDLRVATLNVDESQARYRVSRAALLPTVDASGSATRSYQGAATSTSSSTLSALQGFEGLSTATTTNTFTANLATTSYELDLFGRVRSETAQALEEYFSTEEARRNAQIGLVAQVATQYLTSLQAEQQILLAEQTLSAVLESYRVNQVMFDAGESNELDLRTSQGQVQTARLNLLAFRRQLRLSNDALTLLVAAPLPDDLPPSLALDDPDLLADVPAGLPSNLIERRPDILAAEHSLKAANANIGAARAAFYPEITLTASIGTTSPQLSRLFSAGTGSWSFMPQISLPIFTGGANDANLDVAKIETQIDVANYEKAIQTAFREVSDALWSIDSYRLQVTEGLKLVDAQKRRLELANLRFHQGEDSYLNVTLAQQDLYNAQQNVIVSQLNKLTSQISLYQALGGGWQ